MKFSLILFTIAAGCGFHLSDIPPTTKFGCADDVAYYIDNTFYKYCKNWNLTKFSKFIQCVDRAGLGMTGAISDCGRELTPAGSDGLDSKEGFKKFVCPKPYLNETAFRIDCCLVNHALEFSNRTYTQEKATFAKCTKTTP